MSDWLGWHDAYEAAGSPLARRLAVVRRLLDAAIRQHAGARLRVLSLCAGDGRDVLPVLGAWRGRNEIGGRLVELDPELAGRARAFAAREELDGVEVVCGDAARLSSFGDAAPADLLVACGIFGNVADADVCSLIGSMPAICAAGGSVVWTRHRREPDLTPSIREWFAEAGFEERAFESPGPAQWSVGRHELVVRPRVRALREPLFTFVR